MRQSAPRCVKCDGGASVDRRSPTPSGLVRAVWTRMGWLKVCCSDRSRHALFHSCRDASLSVDNKAEERALTQVYFFSPLFRGGSMLNCLNTRSHASFVVLFPRIFCLMSHFHHERSVIRTYRCTVILEYLDISVYVHVKRVNVSSSSLNNSCYSIFAPRR